MALSSFRPAQTLKYDDSQATKELSWMHQKQASKQMVFAKTLDSLQKVSMN